MNAPVLIIGPPRSGTTLLATMLNAHPRLFIANEAKVFVSLLPRSGALTAPLTSQAASAILRDLEQHELAIHAPLPSAAQVLAGTRAHNIPELIRSLFQLLAEREGKARWGEKTAVAYRQLDAIRRAFPEARLIGMDRDPLQIASSYEKTIPKWGALGGLTNWIDYNRTLARQDSSFELHAVSYAGLTSSPEETLRQVCDFIGEDFHPAMLQFHRTERASKLKGTREFGGVSRGLFTPASPDERLRRGLKGRLVRSLIETGRRAASDRRQPGPGERALRACLFVRAAFWELCRPEFRRRLWRKLSHRKYAGLAANR